MHVHDVTGLDEKQLLTWAFEEMAELDAEINNVQQVNEDKILDELFDVVGCLTFLIARYRRGKVAHALSRWARKQNSRGRNLSVQRAVLHRVSNHLLRMERAFNNEERMRNRRLTMEVPR